jgi:hypothetical protein
MLSNNTNAIGSVATRSAATPDGRTRSAWITAPLPQRKSRAPVIAAPPHSRAVGAGTLRARAHAYIRRPERKNRTPWVVNAGSVSIEKRMPRYVDPHRT